MGSVCTPGCVNCFSSWPTYPQLYVNGELIGGCDIAMQMLQSGELKQLIDSTSKSAA